VTAIGLAGFAAADLDDRPAGGCGAEVRVERDHAVHFCGRDVEDVSEHGHEVWRQVTGLVLHGMKGRHEATGHSGKATGDSLKVAEIRRCSVRAQDKEILR
jgi:hypothetical protein